MSYLVLARKWRPQSFEEVIGQRHITKTLQNAIANDRVAHAFLFAGATVAYAALYAGAAVVPMYETQPEEDWRHIVGDSGAKILFVANRDILERTLNWEDDPGLPELSGYLWILLSVRWYAVPWVFPEAGLLPPLTHRARNPVPAWAPEPWSPAEERQAPQASAAASSCRGMPRSAGTLKGPRPLCRCSPFPPAHPRRMKCSMPSDCQSYRKIIPHGLR